MNSGAVENIPFFFQKPQMLWDKHAMSSLADGTRGLVKAMLQTPSVFCMERVFLEIFGPERNESGTVIFTHVLNVMWRYVVCHRTATKGRPASQLQQE